MKKFLMIIATALTSLSLVAADYKTNIGITINGQASPSQTRVIQAEKQADGTYTFSLNNFVLPSVDGDMGVGNIELTNISATTDADGTTTLSTEQNITITEGNDPSVMFWTGPFLGEVPLKLNGTLDKNNVINIRLDIPFGDQTVMVLLTSEANQIPNSDFEAFHTESMGSKSAEEPNHWHSFMSCMGQFKDLVSSVVHTYKETEILRPGTNGKQSVKLVAGKVLGIAIANGTLTTGRLQAGSMTATNTSNCAFLDMSLSDKDANGDPFYTELRSTPDSLVVWVKFQQGKASTKYPYASINAVITDGTYFQDPGADYTKAVGRAYNDKIESNGFVWQRISCPFTYTDNGKQPKAILVNITTNATPSQANEKDVMYIDDLTLVYNSQLRDIKVDGKSLEGFSPEKAEYEVENLNIDNLSYEQAYEGKVQVFNNADYNCVYVTSFSEDLLSSTTYCINYKTITGVSIAEKAPECRSVVGTFNINGQAVPEASKGLMIVKYSDGTSAKILK